MYTSSRSRFSGKRSRPARTRNNNNHKCWTLRHATILYHALHTHTRILWYSKLLIIFIFFWFISFFGLISFSDQISKGGRRRKKARSPGRDNQLATKTRISHFINILHREILWLSCCGNRAKTIIWQHANKRPPFWLWIEVGESEYAVHLIRQDRRRSWQQSVAWFKAMGPRRTRQTKVKKENVEWIWKKKHQPMMPCVSYPIPRSHLLVLLTFSIRWERWGGDGIDYYYFNHPAVAQKTDRHHHQHQQKHIKKMGGKKKQNKKETTLIRKVYTHTHTQRYVE